MRSLTRTKNIASIGAVDLRDTPQAEGETPKGAVWQDSERQTTRGQ
jgi:hypothetical protein